MKRNENEDFDKYQERRTAENKITKMQVRATGIIGCKDCGKCNVTLRKMSGLYYCEKCHPALKG